MVKIKSNKWIFFHIYGFFILLIQYNKYLCFMSQPDFNLVHLTWFFSIPFRVLYAYLF
jgi:hypothetical protein